MPTKTRKSPFERRASSSHPHLPLPPEVTDSPPFPRGQLTTPETPLISAQTAFSKAIGEQLKFPDKVQVEITINWLKDSDKVSMWLRQWAKKKTTKKWLLLCVLLLVVWATAAYTTISPWGVAKVVMGWLF